MLVNRSGAMVMAFLSIYLSQELQWGDRFAGNAIAVYGAGAVVGSFIGGRLSSTVGAFRVQQASLVGTAIGFVVLSQMESKASVLGTLFVVSVAAESLRPANVTAIAESVPTPLQRRAFALNRLALNLGFTFGPAIGGLLAHYSYKLLFFADGASCMAAAVLLTTMHGTEPKNSSDSASFSHESCASTGSSELASTKQFACFVGLSFVVFLIFFQLLSTYPIFLRNHYAMAEWQIGLLFSINTLIIVAVEMALIDSLRRFRDLRIIAVGTLLTCEGFALLSFGNSYHYAIIALVVWTFGEMIAMPTMMAYVARSSLAKVRAKRIGTYSTTVAFGFVVAPLVGSWCYAIHPRLIWWIAAGLGPIVWFGYIRIDSFDPSPMFTSNQDGITTGNTIRTARELSIRETRMERVEPFV